MTEPLVHLEVKMTPKEYVALKKSADWVGKSVARYIVDEALGRNPRGC